MTEIIYKREDGKRPLIALTGSARDLIRAVAEIITILDETYDFEHKVIYKLLTFIAAEKGTIPQAILSNIEMPDAAMETADYE